MIKNSKWSLLFRPPNQEDVGLAIISPWPTHLIRYNSSPDFTLWRLSSSLYRDTQKELNILKNLLLFSDRGEN
jgi:hypothetical protein